MQEYYDAVFTVSQLNRYLKEFIDMDPNLRSLTIRGELSNFTNHVRSGHFYFTLKDESCSIKAVMFRMHASRVRFRPESGMQVIVTGAVRVFERDGAIQFYCEQMEPDGIGALTMAFEQLKKGLQQEGLFDESHKKQLPRYPKRIGVVTSKTGAALQDIINVLSRRYPLAVLVLIPALVQGEQAAASICSAIRKADADGKLDVLIVGRGGGSLEDLWCFNEESVARAIYACSVPVISAVGHEVDFTIADFAADLRAPTPSAAAELCAPDIQELMQTVRAYEAFLHDRAAAAAQRAEEQVKVLGGRLYAASPVQRIQKEQEQLVSLGKRLENAMEHEVKAKTQQYLKNVAMLEALNPLKVLLRGYSVTYFGEKALTSAQEAEEGAEITTRFADGLVYSTVKATTIKKEEQGYGGEDNEKNGL